MTADAASRTDVESHSGSRAVVVGGGIAGLATAALLAAEGLSVDLLEQRHELGGRVGSWEQDGFRFDTGPSWYLMADVFEHFFELLGTSAAEQLAPTLLDPGYRVFFERYAEPLDVRPDRRANQAMFEAVEPGAGAELERYLTSAKDTYDVALDRFLYTSFDSVTAMADWRLLPRLPKLAGLLGQSLERYVARRFTDLRLRQLLGYPAVFLGSSPARTPSMYHLMSWLDLVEGVRYPTGGFTRIIEAIADLAVAHGARLHTGVEVTEVTTRPAPAGRRDRSIRAAATGVRFRSPDGTVQTREADIVVAAADLHHLETELLPRPLQSYPESWWERRDPGPGAVLVLLGVEGALPQLAHHTLLFTEDWQRNFDAIFESRQVPQPASTYVCKPSATDRTVAPPGCENVFLLVPVPADVTLGRGGRDHTGDPAVERVADAAIEQLASWAGIADLSERIRVRRTVGPGDFADDFHAWSGGALGPAHTLRQSAFLRARNRSAKVQGLYYAGASTIPGIGLPMCLISAELVLDRLRRDRSFAATGSRR